VKSRDETVVNFIHRNEDVTPGQSAVFYDNNIVLGGAIIESATSLRQAGEKEL
jgi:tRNA U34 2-thiouridine synthase MnmA/TrmU